MGHICESILSMIHRVVEKRRPDIQFLSGEELFKHTPYDFEIGDFKLEKGVNYYSADFTYIHVQHSSDPEFAQSCWLD